MPAKRGKARMPARVEYQGLLVVQTPYSFKITVFNKEGHVLYEERANYLYSANQLQEIAKEIREWHGGY